MYPDTIKEQIIEALETASMRQVCARDGMPNRVTVSRWMGEDPEFASRCAHAREEHAEVLFDGMEDIEAQVLSGDLKPDAAKVVLSSRQWRAEKLKPKKFGAKVDLNHSGKVQFERIECVVVDPAG